MNKKNLSHKYFERFWWLFEEGRAAGITITLNCNECESEIQLSGEKQIDEDLIFEFNPAADITKGRCRCSMWEVNKKRRGGPNGK